jgi:MFS transporter, MCT family, solute carrier family 16 (monocarboxylic acid transporters), member 10
MTLYLYIYELISYDLAFRLFSCCYYKAFSSPLAAVSGTLLYYLPGVNIRISALLYSPTISFLSEWFIVRRGFANGIVFAGTACGGLILPLLLPTLLSKYGISISLRIIGVGMTILLFPLLPFVKGRLPDVQVRGPEPRGSRNNLFKDSRFFMLLAVNGMQGFAHFVPIVWLPSQFLHFSLPLSQSS